MDISYLAHAPTAKHWRKIGIRHHHGIAIPLFSLTTAFSGGIGEFPDLIPLIDWCHSIGFDVIQLLPLNDTGYGISPYSALSAFALNPIHLQLAHLPYIDEQPYLKDMLKVIPHLHESQYINYPAVHKYKQDFLNKYCSLVGQQLIHDNKFKSFVNDSSYWLKGYAIFKILKNRHHGVHWENWPSIDQYFTEQLINDTISAEKEQYDQLCIIQFLCDQQLQAVKAHASYKHIHIMGDVPILIDRDSADVWQHRELFDLHYSAGAPPDIYSKEGQNWGFPLYAWQELANQDYRWWKNRLKWADRYYHIYRIDHIVGFFRIWAIPQKKLGHEGLFIPHEENTWIDHGQRILMMMLNACDMLPIGEDLGVVPPAVRACLSALGICGTRVMRWERKWHENGEFILPQHYHIETMTTVSTHDSETLQQWWRDYPKEAKLFATMKGWYYHHVLSHSHHHEILWDSHHTASLFHINPLQEYLALIPGLSWPNIDDERINKPGIISNKNWIYRLHHSIEDLAQNETLRHLMCELMR